MRSRLLSLFLLTGLILGLAVNSARAGDTIEIVHQWVKPVNASEQKLYDALVKEFGTTKGNYYFKVFSACKEDVLLNQAGVPKSTQPDRILVNGREINPGEYDKIVKTGEISKYKVIHYQDTPRGLLHLGQQKGTSAFKPKLKSIPALYSQQPPGKWYTSPYFLIGGVALIAGAGGGGDDGGDGGGGGPPPNMPENIGASVVSAYQVDVFWTDMSLDEDGFRVMRWADGQPGLDAEFNVGPNVTLYSDTSVVPGTRYQYRVAAYNGYGWMESWDVWVDVWNPPAKTYWPMFRGNAQRTAQVDLAGPVSPVLKWTFGSGNASVMDSSPCVGPDHTIYVGSRDWNLYAINQDGTMKWGAPYGANGEVTSSPAIAADGTVYVTDNNGDLHAVKSDGTAAKWVENVGGGGGGALMPSPVIGLHGTIYCSSWGIQAMRPNGQHKWGRNVGSDVRCSPALGPDGSIYFAADNGNLYALTDNGDNWGTKWPAFNLGGTFENSPVVDSNHTVYIANSNDNKFHAVDSTGNKLGWSPYPTGAGEWITTSPALSQDEQTAYFGTQGGRIHAVNLTDGSEKWIYTLAPPSPINSSPIVDDNGIIYFGTDDGEIMAIRDDVTFATEVWSYTLSSNNPTDPILSSLCMDKLDSGQVVMYVGCDDNKLYALRDQITAFTLIDSSWPMFRHNRRHTGRSFHYGPLNGNERWWEPAAMGNMQESPAIDRMRNIWYGTDTGWLMRYDPDGSMPMSFPIGGQCTSPVISTNNNEALYVGYATGGAGGVTSYATEFAAPAIRWTFTDGGFMGDIEVAPTITTTGGATTVYAASMDGKLYAINDDGPAASLKWTYNVGVGIPIFSSPAIGSDGTIYFGANNGRLYAIEDTGPPGPPIVDKWDALPVWLDGAIQSSPAVDSAGNIYVATLNGTIYKISPGGTELAKYPVGAPLGTAFKSSPAINESIYGGRVYIGNSNGKFYALDLDLTHKWDYSTPVTHFVKSSPAIDRDGLIYFGSGMGGMGGIGKVHCLKDLDSSYNLEWTYPSGAGDLPNEVRTSPAIGPDRVIYFGDDGGNIYAIGTDPADIRITKRANKQQVTIGEVITYEVGLTNAGIDPTEPTQTTTVIDRLPAGFKYIVGSTRLDGVKGPSFEPNGANTTTLTFDVGDFAVGESKTLTYQLVVGSGVTFGEYENSARARYYYNVPPVTEDFSAVARETVLVVPDPLFDLGTIIGKVFDDKNGNGLQDEGELGIKGAKIVTEEGMLVTTDGDGKYHIPGVRPGTHLLKLTEPAAPEPVSTRLVRVTEGLLCKVNFGVQNKGTQISADSKDNKSGAYTLVLLGDAEIGRSSVDDDVNADLSMHEDNDPRYDDGTYATGRLAGYFKGTIKNKYQVTSSLDTDRQGNRDYFRHIDKDKYYLTYGDKSSISYEATDTQGPLYLLVETLPEAGLGNSSLLWGNYETSINGHELASYNRTLYGAKIRYESQDEPFPAKATIFGAQVYQLAAHNEIRATGGSFYYLKHKDIIPGSERVRIEVRDKITHLVMETREVVKDMDYEIDYDHGRIIFKLPVLSVSSRESIISTNILNGDPVYVVVDYEYQPDRLHFNENTYGGRISTGILKQELDIPATIGLTYVQEQEVTEDYELKGLDAVIDSLPYESQVTAEYASSESRGIPGHISLDGGLSFSDMISAPTTDGSAYHIRTQSKVDEDTQVKTYFQQMQAGFTAANIMTHQGTKKYGASINTKLSDRINLKLKHDGQRLLKDPNNVANALVGGRKTETTGVQGVYKKDKLTLTGEYRYQKVKDPQANITSETNRDASLGAVRVNYLLPKDKSPIDREMDIFAGQQFSFKGQANYQTTVGASSQVTDFMTAEIQGTSGTDGNSLLLGARTALKGDTQVYTNFSHGITEGLNNPGTRERTSSAAAGVTSQVSPKTKVFAQQEYRSSETATAQATAVGQETSFEDNWKIACNFERGLINNFNGTDTVRETCSLRVNYIEKDKLMLSSKLEVRADQSTQDRDQALTTNNVKYQLNEDLTLIGRLNQSRTENETTNQVEARFKEYGIGLALRPVKWDSLNLLGKYTYVVDYGPAGQSDFTSIDKERANVYALEGAYDINEYFQVVEKVAVKDGEEKVAGYDWVDSRTTLWLNRLNYNLKQLLEDCTLGVEYRVLTQELADDQKAGFLLEAIYKIDKHVQVGLGYNFTDFTDDLINQADYSVRGSFVRLMVTLVK